MNTLALNAQSPQPTATAESNNVAASDTQSSSDSSPVDTFPAESRENNTTRAFFSPIQTHS